MLNNVRPYRPSKKYSALVKSCLERGPTSAVSVTISFLALVNGDLFLGVPLKRFPRYPTAPVYGTLGIMLAMRTSEKRDAVRCWKWDGILSSEKAIDLHSSVSVELLLCHTCGRRWHSGEWPRPVIAA
jgi:hypothetical protein